MIRHHPYGGGYENPSVRRGGSPSGPGPDRSHHRFSQERGGGPSRGRGFGRGRGGTYGSFDGNLSHAYDQGPPQGDMGAYSNYDGAPQQDPFYQNNVYTGGPSTQFGGLPASDGFTSGYGNYEDAAGTGSNFGEEGPRTLKRPIRRAQDDKVHDSIIEERIQRERPCRTLFIRNIKYETNSEDVRHQFEEHGDIKTFFDLISTRGMVFVTYYDLRAAERARERLQGSEISGRPIDVHYSLPRDDHSRGGDKDKNQELQGTLQVTLRNSASSQPIDDNEVRRKFQQFGDVKSVRPVNDRLDSRYVEFYDTRACDEAFDRLRHQGLQDGVMDIVFAWDVNDGNGPSGSQRRDDRGHDWEENGRGPPRGRARGRARGRGRGYDDDWDRRGDYGRESYRGRSRYDDDQSNRAVRGGYSDRFDNRNGGYGAGPTGPTGPTGGYSEPTSTSVAAYARPAAALPVDERLEQARKVQQLLAALKQSQNGTPSTATQTAPPVIQPPQAPSAYYPPPLQHQQPSYPLVNNNPYTTIPPVPSSGQAPGPSLAPTIHALLQQSAQVQQPPPTSQYDIPPPPIMHPTTPMGNAPVNQPGYQQLMAYLQSHAKRPQ